MNEKQINKAIKLISNLSPAYEAVLLGKYVFALTDSEISEIYGVEKPENILDGLKNLLEDYFEANPSEEDLKDIASKIVESTNQDVNYKKLEIKKPSLRDFAKLAVVVLIVFAVGGQLSNISRSRFEDHYLSMMDQDQEVQDEAGPLMFDGDEESLDLQTFENGGSLGEEGLDSLEKEDFYYLDQSPDQENIFKDEIIPFYLGKKPDLQDLYEQADYVVLGKVLYAGESDVLGEGSLIYTDYSVEVLDTFKGIELGSQIKIKKPGGYMIIGDYLEKNPNAYEGDETYQALSEEEKRELYVRQKMEDNIALKTDGLYIFFLMAKKDSGSGGYPLTIKGYSTYEFEGDYGESQDLYGYLQTKPNYEDIKSLDRELIFTNDYLNNKFKIDKLFEMSDNN